MDITLEESFDLMIEIIASGCMITIFTLLIQKEVLINVIERMM